MCVASPSCANKHPSSRTGQNVDDERESGTATMRWQSIENNSVRPAAFFLLRFCGTWRPAFFFNGVFELSTKDLIIMYIQHFNLNRV